MKNDVSSTNPILLKIVALERSDGKTRPVKGVLSLTK